MTTRTLPTPKESALNIAGRTAKQAKSAVDEWTTRRDKAMKLAYSEGASYREIAVRVGLSHQAVKNAIDRLN